MEMPRNGKQRLVDNQIQQLIDNAIEADKHYISLSEKEEAYLIVIPRIDNPKVAHTSLHIGSVEELEIIFEKAIGAKDDKQIGDYLVATRLQSDILFIKDEIKAMDTDEAIIFLDSELGYTVEEAVIVIKFIIVSSKEDENTEIYIELLKHYQS